MPDPIFEEATLHRRFVGDIDGHFFVPGYQRGYRWGEHEVGRLLDDIQNSDGKPYYLQPIVVKKLTNGKWELVDGQQRLTTLFLILEYIRRNALPAANPRYSLEYETRPESHVYLSELNADDHTRNIDFFHIYQAYECIRGWFERQPNQLQAAIDLYTAMSKFVQVIWYEAPPHMDSKELFRRLNVGRIPLTDAELIKALLLARIRDTAGQTDRAHEVAAQWDVIERDLRAPEVWAFVTKKAREEATHIRLILDTLADAIAKPPARGPRPLFHTFETLRPRIEQSAHAVWNDIQDMHSMLLGWYEDRDLYHRIGFLVAVGEPFEAVVDLARDQARSALDVALTDRIRARLSRSADQVKELTYPAEKCTEVLLLMNVESIRRRTRSSERYSFQAHASGTWSLEHIHAQNAEPLRRAEQWTAWLRLHREALTAVPADDEAERDSLLADIAAALATSPLPEDKFRELEDRIVRRLSADGNTGDEVHSIANLALLASGDNSALSNSVFEVKRQAIIERDKAGTYIPACTRDAFLKYYTDAPAQQLHFWGAKDREGYLAEMLRLLTPYLTDSDTV
ncbi:DUF262 domain-containing protein [Actinoplanes teichomyceticus]|uniref:DUF262 domain-containing protein n=1 Tax=Actinoplanes teichomyceticus TaxID=1867 RepID=UPI001944E6A8|nr:DUF262 domain-containing protein [Actinoplanes teichomyceticus]